MDRAEGALDRIDDPERIQRQIEETRDHLTSTLGALERKLSARQVTHDVFDALRHAAIGTADGSKDALEIIKRHPVPAALIGFGIGWLLLDRRRPRSTREVASTTAPAPPSGPGANGADRTAASLADARPAGQTTALGAGGLVLGALIGALLPMTRRERDWLHGPRAQLAEHAEAISREALERAYDVASEAARAAVAVVERELASPSPRRGEDRGDGAA